MGSARIKPTTATQCGIALVLVTLFVVVAVGASVAMLTLTTSETKVITQDLVTIKLEALAETGAGLAFEELASGGDGVLSQDFDNGTIETTVEEQEDGMTQLVVHATWGDRESWLVIKLYSIHPLYYKAIYAGNRSGDDAYELTLSGWGEDADFVDGDIHANGDIGVEANATVDGEVTATGVVTGNETGGFDPTILPPSLASMDYENFADAVDVGQQFVDSGYQRYYSGGDESDRLVPESLASHIFRMNPTHLQDEWEKEGAKPNNYFIEDPHSSTYSAITLSDGTGENEAGNNRVYYLDGNLWLHNTSYLDFYLGGGNNDEAEGLRVTFVVMGNVYFSDNLHLNDDERDALAFIALPDEDFPDSGNIYFGDEEFGTIEEVNGYLYANDTFYDRNLDAAGSKEVVLNGNMTAGDHVLIERDFLTGEDATFYEMERDTTELWTLEEWEEVEGHEEYTLEGTQTRHLVDAPIETEYAPSSEQSTWQERGYQASGDPVPYHQVERERRWRRWTWTEEAWVPEDEVGSYESAGWEATGATQDYLRYVLRDEVEMTDEEWADVQEDPDYAYLEELTYYEVSYTEHWTAHEDDLYWYEQQGYVVVDSYEGDDVIHSRLQVNGQVERLLNGVVPPGLPGGLSGGLSNAQVALWRHQPFAP